MLELRFVARDLRRLDAMSAEVVACGIWRDARPFVGLAGVLDWRLAGRLSRLARQGFLVGDAGELFAMPARPRLPFDKVMLAGLGPRSTFGEATFRRVLERIIDALAGLQIKKAIVELPGRGDDAIAPERAAELLLDVTGDAPRGQDDAYTFVEAAAIQQRIEKHVQERRRTALRARRP